MKNYKQFINEYYTWDDEVTEKTIDLETLYDQQEGNSDHMLQILQYEFRPIQSNDEYKVIKLVGKYSKVNLTLDNRAQYPGGIEMDEKGLLFSSIIRDRLTFRRLTFDLFPRFVFKIKTLKRRFIPEDPYGEEEWDINEAYYSDLSPYNYSWEMPECVNIGWLDDKHDFEKGEVPEGFVEKLAKMPRFVQHCGYHNCPFCEGGRDTWSSSIKLAIGDGVVYLFPELTKHYISKHNYKPPQEFIDAVLKMEDMSESDARRYMNNLMLRHKEHFDKIFHRKR